MHRLLASPPRSSSPLFFTCSRPRTGLGCIHNTLSLKKINPLFSVYCIYLYFKRMQTQAPGRQLGALAAGPSPKIVLHPPFCTILIVVSPLYSLSWSVLLYLFCFRNVRKKVKSGLLVITFVLIAQPTKATERRLEWLSRWIQRRRHGYWCACDARSLSSVTRFLVVVVHPPSPL